MAKYERVFRGDLDEVMRAIHRGVAGPGDVTTFCDETRISPSGTGVRCAVRVYKRYDFIWYGKVTLTVTVVDTDGRIFVSAIAAGGRPHSLRDTTFADERKLLREVEAIVEPMAAASPDLG